MQKAIRAVLVATAFSLTSSVLFAQDPKVELGILTCNLSEARDAPASATPSAESQYRDIHCSFKPKKGAEETYEGRMQGINLSADKKSVILWVVKGLPGLPMNAGFLQQSYAADSAAPRDQTTPPLVGEPNSNVVLSSMEEKEEGSATSPDKPRPTGFVVLALELKLKSTSG